MTLSEIVLSHGEDNDGTAFPYWGIAKYARGKEIYEIARGGESGA